MAAPGSLYVFIALQYKNGKINGSSINIAPSIGEWLYINNDNQYYAILADYLTINREHFVKAAWACQDGANMLHSPALFQMFIEAILKALCPHTPAMCIRCITQAIHKNNQCIMIDIDKHHMTRRDHSIQMPEATKKLLNMCNRPLGVVWICPYYIGPFDDRTEAFRFKESWINHNARGNLQLALVGLSSFYSSFISSRNVSYRIHQMPSARQIARTQIGILMEAVEEETNQLAWSKVLESMASENHQGGGGDEDRFTGHEITYFINTVRLIKSVL